MAESWNPLSGLRVNPNTDPTRAYQPESGKTINTPYTSITHYVDSAVQDMPIKAPASTSYLTVSPTPITMPPPPPPPTTVKIKSATPEIILWDDSTIPVEILTDLIFENIGGQELLSLTRHDIINGDNVSNQLIKNLTSLNQEYSSKRILSLQNTSDKYFSNFSIKLDSKIPFEGNGPLGSNLYVDTETQDIIIELVNLEIDERIEIQIGVGGTIYTITLGAVES